MSETTTVLDALAMTADEHQAAAKQYVAAAERYRDRYDAQNIIAWATLATAHAAIAQAMRSAR